MAGDSKGLVGAAGIEPAGVVMGNLSGFVRHKIKGM